MYNKEEAKQLRIDFWNAFAEYSKQLDYLKPQRGRWMMYYTGIKNVVLKFDVERHVLRVALELNHKRELHRLDVYEQLVKYKPIIDEAFGQGLIWDYVFTTSSGNEVCRLYVENKTFDFHKREHWNDMFAFMADNMTKLEMAFKDIKDFIVLPQ